MSEAKHPLALRAGVILGMAAGFCFAAGAFVLLHELRSVDRVWAVDPSLGWLFGLVPLLWLLLWIRLLRRMEGALE